VKTSDNGRKFIEQWEGLFLHNYDDGTGVQTIGYGHTDAAGPPRVHHGMTITEAEADQILGADLASVEVNVNRVVKVPLTQNQFDALVSFDFNTGALDRSSLLRAVNSKASPAEITTDFLKWDRGGGRVMLGLLRRRRAEAALFNKGDTPQVALGERTKT
jgi:lysozyme